MNRLREALSLVALWAAGCAPELGERCSTAADCPSRQCVAGRCLSPVEPEPDTDARPASSDATGDARTPAADAHVPAPDAARPPPPPEPDAARPPPPPEPDADVVDPPPPPPEPDAEIVDPPPPPEPDAEVVDPPPPPEPDAATPPPPPIRELCDGLDQDGDGQVDEDFPRRGHGCVAGVGACAVVGVELCTPDGLGTACSAVAGDPTPEVCNDIDDNCDGEVDEGVKRLFGRDRDADGYGNPESVLEACEAPVGYVSDLRDCNDRNDAVHPDVKERCNGFDDDCDGNLDRDETGAPVDCSVPHGSSLCERGECAAPACAPGWHDVDGVVDNGCERGCDDGGEGQPVGGPDDGTAEPMSVAGDAPGILWADTSQLDARLHFVSGPITTRAGRLDGVYRAPSLAPSTAGHVGVATRALRIPNSNGQEPARGVMLGLDTLGTTTFEVQISDLAGPTAVSATRTAAGREMALGVVGANMPAGPLLDLTCVDLNQPAPRNPTSVILPLSASGPRPVVRDFDGRFGLVTPNGNGVIFLLVSAECGAPVMTAADFEHPVTGVGLAYTVTPAGRPMAIVAGVDAFNLSVAAIDLSDPEAPVVHEPTRLRNMNTFGSPPSLVSTAGGVWAFWCEEQLQARGFGWPLDFEGQPVADPQVVSRPPAVVGTIDFLRAAEAAGGAGLAWLVATVAGERGPIRQARLTCE